jgi:hypothetical protein
VPDSAVTPYVFVDTEVFRAPQLDLESPNTRRLARLAVGGPVKVLLTKVTKGEVMNDLDEKAVEAMGSIRLRGVRPRLRGVRPSFTSASAGSDRASAGSDRVSS